MMRFNRGRNSELVEIAAELRHETEDAFLIDDGSGKKWVPKSQVDISDDGETFTMPEWLAKEKGFI